MSEQLHVMTEAEYLAWEEAQEYRYEFDGFRPVAMNGGTLGHELIQGNLKAALVFGLRGGPCKAFGPTARVPTSQGRYRYPDAVVTCGAFDPATRDVTTPITIFEVMSDSTMNADRGQKLVEYRAIPSLTRYIMLEQASVMATVVTRVDDHWRIDVVRGGETLDLPEFGLALSMDAIYDGLDLSATSI